MSVLVASLQGRFGNQVMQYLFCRAFAELNGYELRLDPWVGERVFDISHPRPDGRPLRRVNEIELLETTANPRVRMDLEFRGYAQMQCCMIYTKRQAQAWLKLRTEIDAACKPWLASHMPIVAHRRKGDYIGYGYPVVSVVSHVNACLEYGLDYNRMWMLSEESQELNPFLPLDLQFVTDFYRMMTAPTLLRANSTFSWLAALLGNGLVLSPVIEGLEGGREHDCNFVPGNWPRFANLDFVTDLHVAP